MQKHSEKYLRQDWLNLKVLKELYAMSIDPVKDFLLKYPEIELQDVRSRDANEFANYVKNNTYLEDYSEFYKGKELRFISVSEKYEKEKQKKEEAEQLQKKNESLLKEYLKKASDAFDKNDFEIAKKIYEEALLLDIQKNESEIKKKIETCENKLKEIQQQYDEIINQANKYFEEEKWQEALDKYIEAIKIKDDTYPRQQKNKCQKELEKDNINLSELKDLNDFNNGKKIIEKYHKAIGSTLITDKNSISVLKEFIKRCIEKSNRRWKKEGKQDWVLVKKWVGEETAQKWYNEIMNK
jgi:tetratricopeptide (TPR) repeat protein